MKAQVLVLIFGFFLARGQEPVYFTYDQSKGFPENQVYQLEITGDGYIWAGTENGLYRFDGREAVLYRHSQQRGRAVFNLFEDDEGVLWCTNLAGQIFYAKDDKLHLFATLDGQLKGLVPSVIKLGRNVYTNTENRILVFDDSGKVIKTFPFSTYSLKPSKTKKGILLLTNADASLIRITEETIDTLAYFETKHPILITTTEDDYAYLKKEDGVEVFYSEDISSPIISLPEVSSISNILHKNNQLLFATDKGLFNHSKGSLKHYFKDYYVTDMDQDPEGNLWISTLYNGIIKTKLSGITKMDAVKGKSNFTAVIKENDSTLVLGTKDGEVMRFKPFIDQTNSWIKCSNNRIERLFFEPSKNRLFVSATRQVLIDFKTSKVFDLNSTVYKDFEAYDTVLYSTHPSSLNKMKLSVLDTLRLSTINPRVYGSKNTRKKQALLSFSEVVRNKRARSVCITNDRLFCTFIDGLYTLDLNQKDSFNEIKFKKELINGFDLVAGENGEVYVSTITKQVLKIDRDLEISQIPFIPEVNKDERFKKLYYANHRLFALTNKAVWVYNEITQTQQRIDDFDGFNASEATDLTVLKDVLYISSLRGLYQIPLKRTYANLVPPQIIDYSLKINNKLYNLKERTPLRLRNDENNINIRLDYVSYTAANANHLSYRLNTDEPWQVLVDNELTLSELKPAAYTIDFRLKNEDNINSDILSIPLVIIPPLWQQWWFYVLLILVLTVLGFIIFNYFYNKQRERLMVEAKNTSIEKDLINERLRALRSQMNPHFIFNSLNSIQQYIILNKKDEASEYLGDFADLMRLYLNHSKHEFITLSEEIEALRLYFELEQINFEDDVNFSIQKGDTINADKTLIPPVLIQPYVENAIKHGLLHKRGKKSLEVAFSIVDKQLVCAITDNGIGRARSSEINKKRQKYHLSFASTAGQNRLELLNHGKTDKIVVTINDLKDVKGNAIGTKVKLNVPLKIHNP